MILLFLLSCFIFFLQGLFRNTSAINRVRIMNKRTGPNKVRTGGNFDSKKINVRTCTFIRDSRVQPLLINYYFTIRYCVLESGISKNLCCERGRLAAEC